MGHTVDINRILYKPKEGCSLVYHVSCARTGALIGVTLVNNKRDEFRLICNQSIGVPGVTRPCGFNTTGKGNFVS
jgi:hypothetical protein